MTPGRAAVAVFPDESVVCPERPLTTALPPVGNGLFIGGLAGIKRCRVKEDVCLYTSLIKSNEVILNLTGRASRIFCGQPSLVL